mgnify:CR=1 FL=1
MNEQVCTKAVDTCGYPVETTGNAVLDTLEHRSSTRAFARDDDDRPVAVTDEQRAAILHAASRAPSAGAMMMYSIVSIREQATLDRLADLCDHQPMIAKAPWALIFVVDYAKWIDLFEHVGCFEPEFVERTGKAPRRERAKRRQSYAFLLAKRDDFPFVLAIKEVIVVLHRAKLCPSIPLGSNLHTVKLVSVHGGSAQSADLSAFYEAIQRLHGFLNRRRSIKPVDYVKINIIRVQPFE